MRLLARWTSTIVCVFLATAALNAGGWAVITVVRTPDTVVAGEPVTVTYAARQHGQALLNGLQGRIEARLDETVIRATATAENAMIPSTQRWRRFFGSLPSSADTPTRCGGSGEPVDTRRR